MQDLILQQALQHLDPDQYGCLIILAACVPPKPGRKVRSLHEVARLATSPWNRQVEEKPGFFGLESLAGYAITHAHRCTINSRDETTFYPVQWIEHERSTAAFPILRHGRFAGSLLFSSTREYFFSPARLIVMEEYAHLAACIFEMEETFELNEIELKILPPYARQHPYFAGYHLRVIRKMTEANEQGNPISLQQARMLVWQDLEETLLQISYAPGWSVSPEASSERTNI
jgi:GAF domain-containing protein